jgi:hypothetical protein
MIKIIIFLLFLIALQFFIKILMMIGKDGLFENFEIADDKDFATLP